MRKFFTLSQISKKKCVKSYYYWVDSAQDSDLAPFFGDLSQREKHSEIARVKSCYLGQI